LTVGGGPKLLSVRAVRSPFDSLKRLDSTRRQDID
jgi:hypothetical protein